MGKNIYNNKHWREFRQAILEDKETTCFLCNKKKWRWQPRKKDWKSNGRFHLHHLHYDTVGQETLEDVVVLCASCHDILHSITKRRSDSSFITELQQVVLNHIKVKK